MLTACVSAKNENAQALAAYRASEQRPKEQGNREISLDARKEIGRLEALLAPSLTSKTSVTPSGTPSKVAAPTMQRTTGLPAISDRASSEKHIAREPKPQIKWNWVIAGAVVCLIGAQVSSLILPGIVMVGWGLYKR